MQNISLLVFANKEWTSEIDSRHKLDGLTVRGLKHLEMDYDLCCFKEALCWKPGLEKIYEEPDLLI
jgi:hypothetical protein